MANLLVLDAEGNFKYMKASGEGTDTDPQTVVHSDPTLHGIATSLNNKLPALLDGKLVVSVANFPSVIKASSAARNVKDCLLTPDEYLPADPTRLGITFYNDSNTASCYLGFGDTPVSNSDYSYELQPKEFFSVNIDQAGVRVTGVCSAETGKIRITGFY